LKVCFEFGWSDEEVGAGGKDAEWCKLSVPKMDMAVLEKEATEAMTKGG